VRTDLPALIEQCRAQIEPAAVAKGLGFICDIAPGVPRSIFADGTHLRQALLNILQNAVKYTRRGEVALRVTGDADRLRCVVADTGVGVPADQHERLFCQYERLDVDGAGIEGNGLGLAIASTLVKGMGGEIGYDDNPGGGAVFWLEVPIGRVEVPLGALLPEPLRMAGGGITPRRTLRVLVVDDSAANRDVAASFLRGAGHEVIQAAGGAEALDLAETQHFDVVLMDMRMPEMDGLETTQCIRCLAGARGRVPIVAVTAQVLDCQWPTWRAAGVDDYLAKPYERAGLLAAVALAASPAAQAMPPAAAATRPSGRGAASAAQPVTSPARDAPWTVQTMPPLAMTPSAMPPPAMTPSAMTPSGVTARSGVTPTVATATSDAAPGAGLAPPAPAPADALPVLNPEIAALLDACVEPEKMVAHLTTLAADIETVLAMLQPDGCRTKSVALQAVTHKLAGDAGQLGFVALSAAARRHETARHEMAGHDEAAQRPGQTSLLCDPAAALRDIAGTTLVALRQRLDLIRRTVILSASPP
jgi:CheY-like chemotaxis protein